MTLPNREISAACAARRDDARSTRRAGCHGTHRAGVVELVLGGTGVLLASRRRAEAVHRQLIADLSERRGGSGSCSLCRVRLDHDRLGRPMLVDPATGCEHDLAVSFSHTRVESWAALAPVRVGDLAVEAWANRQGSAWLAIALSV